MHKFSKYKAVLFPLAHLLFHLILVVHHVVRVTLGMSSWLELLALMGEVAFDVHDLCISVAALLTKQDDDTPRCDRNVPPAC